MRGVWDRIQYWNTTPAERAVDHPADAHVPAGATHFVRAIDVDADPVTVFRWLCQIKVAPYSYDLIDNLGRRSPPILTPGADHLELGQMLTVAPIVDFEIGRHITAATTGRAARVFGGVVLSYQVVPGRSTRSRILVCLALPSPHGLGRLWHAVLGAGDLVMMRRQLLNLKRYAEATDRA
jgi:hypothetical protein